MTKENPYQIGAPTDKPQTSFFKPNRNQNQNRSNDSNSDRKPFQKNKPINKRFNSQKRPFNKNNQRQPQRSFNNRDRKPFNRDQRKPFDRNDRKPFNRSDRKPFQKNDRKPFNRNQRKPFDRNQRRPYNRDGNNERKPFNRDGNNERRPYNRDGSNERKPFNRDQSNDRKPYNRNENNERKPYNSQKNSNKKFDESRQNKNIKHQEKQIKQANDKIVQNNVQASQQKGEQKAQKPKVQKIKHNRVIVRNLVFDINVNHLKKLLTPFGEVLDVHIPQNPDGKGSRGFAFIEFKNRNNALKAIKQLNGTQFKGRTIVLDESISKQKFIESKVNEQEDANEENKIKEQVKNKVKLEENKKQKMQDENQNDEEQLDDENEDEQSQQENEEDDEVKNQDVKKEGSKRQKTESQILEDISSEVFIRNLPINVDEKTLHSFFRRYGKLKFAKVVMNKQTGLSKGSAFLKFQDPLKAKELVQYSRSYQMNLLGKNPNFKVNAGINLELQGIVLKLFPVESRQNISEKVKGREQKDAKREQLKKQAEKKKKPLKKVRNLQKLVQYDPNDKRNLKLALLGMNKITEQMREKDQERFRNHEKQKLAKLKNPNNSVCDTRIILKYLNKDITEQDIRNLCLQYLAQTSHKANDLTYCKLMLESLESKKSAGFAFVEFKTHPIALGFLQWMENEPTKLMKEPFVCQFAIQDSRKLQKLQNRNSNPNTNTKKPQNSKGKSDNKNRGNSGNKSRGNSSRGKSANKSRGMKNRN